MTCSFVPAYLLEQIARSDAECAPRAIATLTVDALLRDQRASTPAPRPTPTAVAPGAAAVPDWTVHTARNTTTLPGTAVRGKGDPASGDTAVDEAADGIDGALRLFAEVFDRSSYDGAGADVSLTVHYGRDYDNAFWEGTQLVFGDGAAGFFDRFTKPVAVLGTSSPTPSPSTAPP